MPAGHTVATLRQYTAAAQVSPALRRQLVDCWVTVTNAGGAVGFPFPPVDEATVAPAADDLIAGLDPDLRRLLVAVRNDSLAGWVSIHREANPLITHWGTISRLQADPAFRGQGIGSALMIRARQIAREEMHVDQLRLAVRGGMGLEAFYQRLGWTIAGRWPRALRFGPDDFRDEILMILTPL
ncbi:MAG: GNAT family N-acetyltransferase [Streptosporangiaceae bacterium]